MVQYDGTNLVAAKGNPPNPKSMGSELVRISELDPNTYIHLHAYQLQLRTLLELDGYITVSFVGRLTDTKLVAMSAATWGNWLLLSKVKYT